MRLETNAPKDPTLTQALDAAGYSHRPIPSNPRGRREILSHGNVIARLMADEAWAWLRRREHIRGIVSLWNAL